MLRSTIDKKITVYLRGGLGNQLFQYFTGLEIQKRYGGKIVLDTSLLPLDEFVDYRGVSVFPFQLDSFDFTGEARRGKLYRILPQSIAHFIYTRFAQFQRLVVTLPALANARKNLLANDAIVDLTKIPPKFRELHLTSLCLSTHPNLELYDRDLLSLGRPVNPSEWFKSEAKLIESEMPVAIHIRLGDHVRLGAGFDRPYLERVIGRLRERGIASPIWIFSDEPDLASKILDSLRYEFRIIRPPVDSPPLESLVLMSMASTLVMARSTFSYWAACLSSVNGKTVLINREWFANGTLPVYMKAMRANWIKV